MQYFRDNALFFMMLALASGVTVSGAGAQTPPQPNQEQVEAAERECRDRLQTIEAEAVMPETDVPLLPQGDLNIIREAAVAFARAGHQQGCEEVAGELQTLLEERREAVEKELELQRVRQAIPIPQLPFTVTTSELVGSKVVNHELEELGTLEDLILTESEGRYALIRHGGFLGIGRNYAPVALERLRMTEDGKLLVIHISEELFGDAPEIDPDQLAEVQTWSQTIEQWWVANAGPQPGAGQPAQPQPAPEEAVPAQAVPPPASEPAPPPPQQEPAPPEQQPAAPPPEQQPTPAPPEQQPEAGEPEQQ